MNRAFFLLIALASLFAGSNAMAQQHIGNALELGNRTADHHAKPLTELAATASSAASSSSVPIHFIDVHSHYIPLGPEFPPKSKMAVKFGFTGMPVSELIAGMNRWGVDVLINEMSPSSIWLGGTQDDYGIPKLGELYPRRIFSLYGGKALRLLYRVVERGGYTPQQERTFVRLIEQAMQSGEYKGFGEIGLYHMETVKRANLTIPADHP